MLEEVELGVGRPDIIVLAAQTRATLRRAAGLGLRDWTERARFERSIPHSGLGRLPRRARSSGFDARSTWRRGHDDFAALDLEAMA